MRATTWRHERRTHASRARAARAAPERPRRLLVETLESRLLLSADPLGAALAEIAHAEPFPQGVVAWLADLDRVEDVAREAPAALPTGAGRLELHDAFFERAALDETPREAATGGTLRDAHRSGRAADILSLRVQETEDATDAAHHGATTLLLSLPEAAPSERPATAAQADHGAALVFDAIDPADGSAEAQARTLPADGGATRPDFGMDDLLSLPAAPQALADPSVAAPDVLATLAAARTEDGAAAEATDGGVIASALVFVADAEAPVAHDALASWGIARAADRMDSLFTFDTDPFALIETA